MHRNLSLLAIALFAGVLVVTPVGPSLSAQTTARAIQPGFNLFSVNQDVEIGRSSAIEADKQLRLLNDPATTRYVTRVIQRLAAVAPGAKYPYTIKVVNAPEINAFALPGGPMYVNRGLIVAARSEAELAGVLAHEMAHVALRHGTNQASTAYLAKGGVSILGNLLGKGQGNASAIVNTIGGLGLNTAFLSFGRTAEYQADATGADIMARAGYSPKAMADFFEVLRAEQGRDPSKVEQFFSDHPGATERATRIRQLASTATVRSTPEVGGFAALRAALGQGTVAVATAPPAGRLSPTPDEPTAYDRGTTVQVAPPSTRLVRYLQPGGFLTLNHPANWQVVPNSGGTALVVAPAGGIVQTSDGQQRLLYGVILNHYAPFASGSVTGTVNRYAPFEDGSSAPRGLNEATDDLVNTIIRANPYLRAEVGSARGETISGAPGYSVLLSGTSPVTGEAEQATLFTRGLPDGHVVYALAIVPASSSTDMDRALVKMMRSLVVRESAGHRAAVAPGSRGLRLGARQQP